MKGDRRRHRLGPVFAIGLLCLGSCSKQSLTDPGVPPACTAALPKRCDVCSTGETICAHYVVRDGICVVETCPPAPARPDAATAPDAAKVPDASAVPDAWVPGVDATGQDAGLTPFVSCGPADAGLLCSCGSQPYFPPPVNDAGQQLVGSMPDPATVVAYRTMAKFDALAVGRWQRTAGMSELTCEQFGVEFTADHRLVPLGIAIDGTVQPVTGMARSFSILFDSAGSPTGLVTGGLHTNPPIFFDGGRSMYFLYAPWPANYVRAP